MNRSQEVGILVVGSAGMLGRKLVERPLRDGNLPVDDSIRTWFASPRAAIGFLIHAANLDSATLGSRRTLTMPGLSATVETSWLRYSASRVMQQLLS
jgi:hypothetical protein